MRLQRLFSIVSMLTTGQQTTAKKLSDLFGVSLRTIYRDLHMLEEAGIPLTMQPGNNGGVGIVPGYTMNRTAMTKEELGYIISGIAGLSSITDTEKIKLLLSRVAPLKNTIDFGDIVIDFTAWNKNTTEELKTRIQLIRSAIANHQMIGLEYISKNKLSAFDVAPHLLVFKSSSWYLYGCRRGEETLKFFKLSRMVRLYQRSELFTRMEIQSIPTAWDKDFDQAMGEKIELLFHPALEYRIIDTFGHSGYEKDDSGNLLATFFSTDEAWLLAFLLGFADGVKILSPPSLQQAFQQKLEQMKTINIADRNELQQYWQ